VTGISVYNLPPVKVMLYADDVNLFLSTGDSLEDINTCLRDTSYAIGSKFNLEKTDVKLVGPPEFRQRCFEEQSMLGSTLPGAYVLPPGGPLRVLGVWIDSVDFATHRWAQIEGHVGRIIRQWCSIGASVLNRATLAKALMLSRCHFLMDGNGIPGRYLGRLSNRIQRFVRGGFSDMAYRTLEVPLMEGGLNCPSLRSRKKASDLKFLSDLISGPQRVPWKQWTWQDIRLASFSSASTDLTGLNPFTQRAHIKPALLQDRVRQAFLTAQQVGLDLACAVPSLAAREHAPAIFHPVVPKNAVLKKVSVLKALGVRTMKDIFLPPGAATLNREGGQMIGIIRRKVSETSWSPLRKHYTHPPGDSVVIWPAMTNTLGCVRVFTDNSLLTTAVQIRAAAKKCAPTQRLKVATRRSAWVGGHLSPRQAPPPLPPVEAAPRTGSRLLVRPYELQVTSAVRDGSAIVFQQDIHVWTDGSAFNNGLESCSAGAAWVTNLSFHDEVSLSGISLSNNVAEVAAIVLCLLAWRDAHLVVHTDSSFVLGLVKGGLLAMERDGWGDSFRHLSMGTPTELLRYALYLLRDRSGRIEFIKAKAHADDEFNNLADFYANQGRLFGRNMDLSRLKAPAAWVDSAPVLAHQPLDFLTKLVVRHSVPPPTNTLRFTRFSDRWVVAMGGLFGVVLDPGLYVSNVWRINIPFQLREVLWREINGNQVLGSSYHGKSDLGRKCRCGSTMSLDHILLGCYRYDLSPLQVVLRRHLAKVSPSVFCRSLWPDEWHPSPWYPLLALRRVERNAARPTKTLKNPGKALSSSRPQREWLIGTYFWNLWRWRMKEIHDTSFWFIPHLLVDVLGDVLGAPPPDPTPKKQAASGGPSAAAEHASLSSPPLVEPGANSSSRAGRSARVPPAPAASGLSSRGQAILRGLVGPTVKVAACPGSRRAAILQVLTEGAFD